MPRPSLFISPAQPALSDRPPHGHGWVHEVKFDGYRVQLHKAGYLLTQKQYVTSWSPLALRSKRTAMSALRYRFAFGARRGTAEAPPNSTRRFAASARTVFS